MVKNGENLIEETHNWTNQDDFLLVKGIFSHGYDNWKTILDDKSIWINDVNSKEESNIAFIFKKIEKRDFAAQEESKARL